MKTLEQQNKQAAWICLGIGLAIITLVTLSGCGKGDPGDAGSTGATGDTGATGAQGPAGPVTVVPSPTPTESDVQTIVDDENTNREAQGQAALTAGLGCTVQLMGSGQWLSSASPGYNAGQGVLTALAGSSAYGYLFTNAFNQPDTASGVNGLLPTGLQNIFVGQNYKISCNGQIVVTTDGYYGFDMNSDDGSILTIDGAQVINNDGNHAMTDKVGTKYLRRAVHTFSLLYAQSGGGNFGLILQANGSVIPGSVFYH
jgi:PA14 domain